jgi:hypothetical protein
MNVLILLPQLCELPSGEFVNIAAEVLQIYTDGQFDAVLLLGGENCAFLLDPSIARIYDERNFCAACDAQSAAIALGRSMDDFAEQFGDGCLFTILLGDGEALGSIAEFMRPGRSFCFTAIASQSSQSGCPAEDVLEYDPIADQIENLQQIHNFFSECFESYNCEPFAVLSETAIKVDGAPLALHSFWPEIGATAVETPSTCARRNKLAKVRKKRQ